MKQKKPPEPIFVVVLFPFDRNYHVSDDFAIRTAEIFSGVSGTHGTDGQSRNLQFKFIDGLKAKAFVRAIWRQKRFEGWKTEGPFTLQLDKEGRYGRVMLEKTNA